jgi:tetratricopeptide (TPR) repeat protein
MTAKKINSSAWAAIQGVGIFRMGLALVLGVAGAWLAFALAVSGITRSQNAPVALMLVPQESAALATRADMLFFTKPTDPPKIVKELALKSLRQQGINAKALRILGFYEDTQGRMTQAEAYIRRATTLSRREQNAQLWLIETEARRGDLQKTLVHYDIALRTKPDTQLILFPRLLSALDDADVRKALTPYIKRNRIWAEAFLYHAIAYGKNLPAVADLFIETGGVSNKSVAQKHSFALLTRLVNERNYVDARRLYLKLPKTKPNYLSSLLFEKVDIDSEFGPLSWQLFNNSDAGSQFDLRVNGEIKSLTVFANSATTQAVAQKYLFFSPGAYKFTFKTIRISRDVSGYVNWKFYCETDAGSKLLWETYAAVEQTVVSFIVPEDCKVQLIQIVVSGGKGQIGTSAVIAESLIE